MKKLLAGLILLCFGMYAQAITIFPAQQQSWTIDGAPESTLVLGQGGTIFVGDQVRDTSTGRVYQFTAVGDFDIDTQTYIDCEFKELIFDTNLGDFIGINQARPYSTVSSPAFNTSRQPNATHDVQVTAGVTLTSVLLGSATVTPQISADNSTWDSLPPVEILNVAAGQKVKIDFIVPASYYYRLTSDTAGIGASAALNSVQELSN